ncbi:MAG: potassium/proton antiporter [Methanobrevibacter sp.]|jgi:cell volume regulation protein A|nr:potassium/proton antiporter [Candidatus Methanoflexus mossambicus]
MLSLIPEMLLIAGIILLVSVILSKLSSHAGIPVLLVFLVLGMFMGSEGPVGIYFDNYTYVQYICVFALTIILFSGGLDTDIKEAKPIAKSGIALGTIGVLITAITTGLFIHFILGFDLIASLLIGSIISSTDVSAVISIFRTNKLKLKHRLEHLIEFESAVNDPMANILTLSFVHLMLHPKTSIFEIILSLIQALVIGTIFGFISGKLSVKFINKINLETKGLYPVILIAIALLSFSVSEIVGGSGFLAVYISSLLIGNSAIVSKKAMVSFFDGLAWLMQIIMFIILGLVVFPSELIPSALTSLIIAVGLILIARPLAVYLCMLPSNYNFKEKLFISWTGIKGAVPIVFATYPLVAGIKNSLFIFNIVFFITIISILLQGSTIKILAKKLKLIQETDPGEFLFKKND